MSTTETINLQAFCEGQPLNTPAGLGTPFVSAGWRYASNCVIAVRVPADGEPDDSDTTRPDLASFFRRTDWPRLPLAPWPTDGLVSGEADCAECNATGKNRVACQKCDGEGWVVCAECGNRGGCRTCRGRGYTWSGQCLCCRGRGSFGGPLYRTIAGGRHVKAKYDTLVGGLPDVRYSTGGTGNDGIYFVFDGGGEGFVMPYKPSVPK